MERSSDYTLYGTDGCHLCEQAQALMEQIGAVDYCSTDIIDNDDDLARYRVVIPVLKHNQSERELLWPFDITTLNAFLEQCSAN
ncbi:glutaredoxin family protein [Aliagarivorans marinus]|uniref:glutaredoxin family protein n=1 Tax=Aliagarivorans marinus TaxID=561965 RepID=UPI00047B1848|nr:glutaredoxin family protein [Aliagarivorans marinus]